MVPFFVRNLIPRREARAVNRRTLFEALRTMTWTQWAQFLSGFVSFPATSSSRWKAYRSDCLVDLLLGLAT